jgi:hypothetical protein
MSPPRLWTVSTVQEITNLALTSVIKLEEKRRDKVVAIAFRLNGRT